MDSVVVYSAIYRGQGRNTGYARLSDMQDDEGNLVREGQFDLAAHIPEKIPRHALVMVIVETGKSGQDHTTILRQTSKLVLNKLKKRYYHEKSSNKYTITSFTRYYS